MAGKLCNLLHGLKPAILMVLVQVVFGGVNVFYKLAMNDGMSMRVLVAYRFMFASAFVAPLAFILERKSRPRLTWMVVFQGFLCGLFGGVLGQNLYVEALALTSATFAAAMTNLIPAITFVLAITLGLERLAIRTLAGNAKLLGTALSVSGAMVLTFYKGLEVNIWSTNVNLIQHLANQTTASHRESGNHVLGSLLAVASCFSYAICLIIQAKMSKRYPCQYSSTAMMCISASIQAVVYAMCTERDWSAWKLGWNIRLLTVAYSGILASGLMFSVIAWCILMRGPLFVSIFNPLMLIFVAVVGSLILDEKLHLGSVLGAVLITIGLYAVLWGKSKEMKKMAQLAPSKSSRELEMVEVNVTSSSGDTNQMTKTIVAIPYDDQKAGVSSAAIMGR